VAQIDDNDDSASVTRKHVEAIQEYCDSHLLEPYVFLFLFLFPTLQKSFIKIISIYVLLSL